MKEERNDNSHLVEMSGTNFPPHREVPERRIAAQADAFLSHEEVLDILDLTFHRFMVHRHHQEVSESHFSSKWAMILESTDGLVSRAPLVVGLGNNRQNEQKVRSRNDIGPWIAQPVLSFTCVAETLSVGRGSLLPKGCLTGP